MEIHIIFQLFSFFLFHFHISPKKCKIKIRGGNMFDTKYIFEEDNFSGVIILLDKNLNILKFNSHFGLLQGYKESDLFMKPFVDIIVPEDKSLFLEASFNSERSKDFTVQCYHRQGAFRYFSFNMISFKEYTLLFGNTIKKQFNSYEYVDESLNYLEKAFSNLDVEDIADIVVREDKNMSVFLSMFPIDIWIKDRFNRYIFINEVYTTHTGHTLDDIYLRDDFQLFPKDIAKGFTKSDKEAISKGKKITYTFYSSNNKLLTWTEVTKIPLYNIKKEYIGLLSFSSDITESKMIEDRLNNIIYKYEDAFKNMEILVLELDLEGNIVFAFGGLVELEQVDSNKLLQENILKIVKNTDLEKSFQLVREGNKSKLNVTLLDKKMNIELIPHYVKEEISCIIVIAKLAKVNENE